MCGGESFHLSELVSSFLICGEKCWPLGIVEGGGNVGERTYLTGPYLPRTMAGVSVHSHFPHLSQFCVS